MRTALSDKRQSDFSTLLDEEGGEFITVLEDINHKPQTVNRKP